MNGEEQNDDVSQGSGSEVSPSRPPRNRRRQRRRPGSVQPYQQQPDQQQQLLQQQQQQTPAIPPSDRDALKQNIFPLLIASPSRSVQIQLACTLRSLISHEFPERWHELAGIVKGLLGSQDVREVTAGVTGVLEIVKVYR